jgi:hypothetical protein
MQLIHLNRERYFSFDFDELSKKYYLCIPVSNSRIDYMEYYEVPKEFVDAYPENIEDVEKFVLKCRQGLMFHCSLHPRAPDRGEPIWPDV